MLQRDISVEYTKTLSISQISPNFIDLTCCRKSLLSLFCNKKFLFFHLLQKRNIKDSCYKTTKYFVIWYCEQLIEVPSVILYLLLQVVLLQVIPKIVQILDWMKLSLIKENQDRYNWTRINQNEAFLPLP